MKTPKYETYENDLLKADLLLSDYTLATDPKEKQIYLSLLDRYVTRLQEPEITVVFSRLATVNNDYERNIYIEILTDILADYKADRKAV